MRKKRTVVLLRRVGFGFPRYGSQSMRSTQLAQLVAPFLPSGLQVKVLGVSPNGRFLSLRTIRHLIPSGAVVIFIKHAAKGHQAEDLFSLRRKCAAIGVDHIDQAFDEVPLDHFNFHLAASMTQKQALADHFERNGITSYVDLLDHHADPILNGLRLQNATDFSACYLGALKNSIIPDDIKSSVEAIEVNTTTDMQAAAMRVKFHNLHFAVRPIHTAPPPRRLFKPFTKGFTAASCRANIIVNRETDDALRFLGEDYPYLVKGNDPSQISEAFYFAQESFGSPLWLKALGRMQAVKEMVSPNEIARQLISIVREVAS